MAKASATSKAKGKPVAPKAPAKKAAPKPKAAFDIEKISEDVLATLRTLDIEHALQADIDWCLGSYRADKNPIGLFDMINRALPVLKGGLLEKKKGVKAKLIADMEMALDSK